MKVKPEDAEILIVDDTLKNIQVLGTILKQQGYKICVAQSGLKAIETAEKLRPDLILLDIMMPEMDGFEVCKRLKSSEKTSYIPVIFLSARDSDEDIMSGFQLGAVDYICKPFNSGELLQRVYTHVELKKSREELEKQNYHNKQLLHVLTHDLANPIGNIISFLDLLGEHPDSQGEFLKQIRLISNNSLDIIRLTRESMALDEYANQLTLNSYSLKELVHHSINFLKNTSQKKGVLLKENIAEGVTVNVERVSFINSVLNNLLTNAIKFSKRGDQILISGSQVAQKTVLSVTDNGVGIPDGIKQHLFDLSKPTSRPGTSGEIGTGFGMPLVKKFVEAYGGEIKVDSNDIKHDSERHGTTITIVLNVGG